MATQLQSRRGTTAQMNAFTGAEGEIAVNTSTDTLHVHDGSTAGGHALAKADGSNISTYAGSFTTLAASGAATLSSTLAVTSKITANGGIDIDNFNIDGTTIALSSGGMILDSAGNITLDADGAEIIFKDGGTQFGEIYKSGNDLRLESNISNGNLVFSGNDGGTGVVALTLNMGAAGAATFNSTVTAATLVSANGVLELDDNGSHNGIINVPAGLFINIDSDNSATNETFIIAKDRTSTSGGTVLYSISEAGNAEQKGAGSADFRIIAATDNATITLQAGASDTGAEAAMIYYLQNSTYKYEVGMNTNNSYRIYSYAAGSGAEVLRVGPPGGLSVAANGASTNTNENFHSVRNGTNNEWIQSLQSSGTPPYGIPINYTAAAPNGTSNYFLYCADTAAARFYIESNGNVKNRNSSYLGISDLKLKQDIVDASNQWDDIKNIRFRKYKFKTDVVQFGQDAVLQLGVIAQELESAGMSGLVSESPDIETVNQPVLDESGNATVDEDGNPITEEQTRKTGTTTKAVNYSVMNMKAMVALQEAMARIETLEAKVTALESK